MGCRTRFVPRFVKRFTFALCVFAWLQYSQGESECTCKGGCEPNKKCDPEGNCKKENVAYLKKTSISSRYQSRENRWSGPSCVAVNGRTNPTFKYNDTDEVNCIHTAAGDQHWWMVDLGKNYTIANVTIYRRKGSPRLNAIWIYVDEQLCFDFPDSEYTANRKYSKIPFSIDCKNPMRGQVVKFSKERNLTSSDNQFINICEVQIWVCKPGLYGKNCDQNCSRNCKNSEICDNFYGTCHAGCADRFYGKQCHNKCGLCKHSDICNSTSGKCPRGCQLGYQHPFCNDTCSNNTYGEDCNQTCGQCASSSACDHFNGTCSSGCQENFVPPLCKDCKAGFYGAKCLNVCDHCKDLVCDFNTGNCIYGCQRGYKAPLCQNKCINGTYGENCASVCGRCKGESACDIYSGYCSACEEGYLPPLCSLTETSQGAIIGGAVTAVIVVLVLLAVIGFLVFRKRQREKQANASKSSKKRTANRSDGMHTFAMSDTGVAAAKPGRTMEQPIYVNTIVPTFSEVSLQGSDSVETGEEADEGQLLDESSDCLYGNIDGVYATFQATCPALDRVQTYLVGRLASGELQQEFKDIPKFVEGEPQEAANLEINIKKNRFRQVLPYDRSRVVLKDGYSKRSATDFINASYIKGYGSKRMYIAAQGPRQNTVDDFWRMVWQEQITDIVMLANLIEDGKDKCSQYWPEMKSGGAKYGPVKVTTSEIDCRDNFYIRTFIVQASLSKFSRVVTQYHYGSWPDHGVPTTTSLVRFWHYIRSRLCDSPAPLLVHCSAGVGRTGSFIGLDIGNEIAVHEGRISILDLVKRLRQDRTLMVQAVEQYVFLHEALLEAYTAHDTVISLDNFDTIFPQQLSASTPNQRIDNEFKSIMQMRTKSSNPSHNIATQEDNMKKNRSVDVLPSDDHIVYLTEHVQGRNQYINAISMSTLHDPRGSILTQLPLPSTLVDFWRLVFGNNITTIVSLCSPNEEREVKSFCQYWPKKKGALVQSTPYTISLKSKKHLRPGLTSYVLSVSKKDVENTQRVRLLHFEGWEQEAGCDTSDIMHLLDLAFPSNLQDNPAHKLLIQCRDGAGKSGLFSALGNIVTRIICDHEIDVYMAVRHLHSVVPQAVISVAQYRYCYAVAQAKSRDRNVGIYANT